MTSLPFEVCLKFLNLDATASATTTLFTTLNGTQGFYPTRAYAHPRTITTFVAVPTLSIGQNSATYNDIVTATALTGLNSTALFIPLVMAVPSVVVAVNTPIKVVVTVGALAAAYRVDIHLFGFYQS